MNAVAPRLYPVEEIGRGFLALMAHPASHGDAAAVLAALAEQGVLQVVSLLQPAEAAALGLRDEAGLARIHGLAFQQFAVPDMGLPESIGDFANLAQRLYRQVDAGQSTVIHCRAGVGRSGLLAAAVLMQGGFDAHAAFAQVARRRGMPVPETTGQGDWLAGNATRIVERGRS